jgi:hypothetical protein
MYKNYLILIHYRNVDGTVGEVKRKDVYFGITEEILKARVDYNIEIEFPFVYEFEIKGTVDLLN